MAEPGVVGKILAFLERRDRRCAGGLRAAVPVRVLTVVPILVVIQVMAVPALVLLGLWFVFQFVSGELVSAHATGGVAWWAHVAGFVYGCAVMAPLSRAGASRTRERETPPP